MAAVEEWAHLPVIRALNNEVMGFGRSLLREGQVPVLLLEQTRQVFHKYANDLLDETFLTFLPSLNDDNNNNNNEDEV